MVRFLAALLEVLGAFRQTAAVDCWDSWFLSSEWTGVCQVEQLPFAASSGLPWQRQSNLLGSSSSPCLCCRVGLAMVRELGALLEVWGTSWQIALGFLTMDGITSHSFTHKWLRDCPFPPHSPHPVFALPCRIVASEDLQVHQLEFSQAS